MCLVRADGGREGRGEGGREGILFVLQVSPGHTVVRTCVLLLQLTPAHSAHSAARQTDNDRPTNDTEDVYIQILIYNNEQLLNKRQSTYRQTDRQKVAYYSYHITSSQRERERSHMGEERRRETDKHTHT